MQINVWGMLGYKKDKRFNFYDVKQRRQKTKLETLVAYLFAIIYFFFILFILFFSCIQNDLFKSMHIDVLFIALWKLNDRLHYIIIIMMLVHKPICVDKKRFNRSDNGVVTTKTCIDVFIVRKEMCNNNTE